MNPALSRRYDVSSLHICVILRRNDEGARRDHRKQILRFAQDDTFFTLGTAHFCTRDGTGFAVLRLQIQFFKRAAGTSDGKRRQGSIQKQTAEKRRKLYVQAVKAEGIDCFQSGDMVQSLRNKDQ